MSLLTSSPIEFKRPMQIYFDYFATENVHIRVYAVRMVDDVQYELYSDIGFGGQTGNGVQAQWKPGRMTICLVGGEYRVVFAMQFGYFISDSMAIELRHIRISDEDAVSSTSAHPAIVSPPPPLGLCWEHKYPSYENSITCSWLADESRQRPLKFCGWHFDRSGTGSFFLNDRHSGSKFVTFQPTDNNALFASQRFQSPLISLIAGAQSARVSFWYRQLNCTACLLEIRLVTSIKQDNIQRVLLNDTRPGQWRPVTITLDVARIAMLQLTFDVTFTYPVPYGEWIESGSRAVFELDRTWCDAETGFGLPPRSDLPSATTTSDVTGHTINLFEPDGGLILGLGVVGGFTIVSLTVVAFVVIRRRQQTAGTMQKSPKPSPGTMESSRAGSMEVQAARKLCTVSVISQYTKLLDVAKDTVEISEVILGKGEFGIVFKALAHKLPTVTNGPTVVAIKAFLQNSDIDHNAAFQAEYRVMLKAGRHVNIVNILGIVQQDPPYIILEYCRFGSLQKYLRSHRNGAVYVHVDGNGRLLAFNENDMQMQWMTLCQREDRPMDMENMTDHMLSTGDLIAFSRQICRGMEYLASRSVIHRDLAARNVLVSDHRIMKISDFGLAKHGYESYTVSNTSASLPIFWMPPDTIISRKFSEKSDVWSFGILMWEIFSLGELPFAQLNVAKLSSNSFAEWLLKGNQMDRPSGAPADVHKLMQKCWTLKSEKRPVLSEIVPLLDHLLLSCSKETKEYLPLGDGNSIGFLS